MNQSSVSMSNNTEFNSNEWIDWIDWIEEAITKKHIKYYDYKHFNNIQEIGSGSFGKLKKLLMNLTCRFVMDNHGLLRQELKKSTMKWVLSINFIL
ncbi:unnamed protein product [Rhizophagus irregularis]|nr:unnamed protein product [Rhizophagus irregularis]